MHDWGDKDFHYWKELGLAAEYISKFCLRWGRISVRDWKEKYGTVRVYCGFGWYQLPSVFYPRTMFYGDWKWYSRWLWRIYVPHWVSRLALPWQTFIYRTAYKNAIKKWPMIRKEILCCADWSEYLGGL